jgi:tRNA (mo5U34)-methyltransferase
MEPTMEDSKVSELNKLRDEVNSLPWFHQIDLGDGLITPGRTSGAELRLAADAIFDQNLSGKTVIDIGCYDGFFSFEAKRRGASRVLATDFFIWNHDKRCRKAFELARARVGLDVEDRVIDIHDLSVSSVGKFDIVLFSGVFYHLRHPFFTLEAIAKLAIETLVVETHLDALDVRRPAMIFYPTTELNNDPTNWWGPNVACVEAMLRDIGFPRVIFRPNPNHPINRGIFQGRRLR